MITQPVKTIATKTSGLLSHALSKTAVGDAQVAFV